MRKWFLVSILSSLLFSCAPKLGTQIVHPQPVLDSIEPVIIFDVEDHFNNEGIFIGKIKAGDNGFSTHCSHEEVMSELRMLARKNGANVLKIITHKEPDQFSSCDRIKAEIYRVDDFREYEKQIAWSSARKLVWEDFKGIPDNSNTAKNIAAQTNCGFQFNTYYPTLFGKPKLAVDNIFNCKLSWVREAQKNQQGLLAHEQAHFDLCEIYARKLRKEFAEAKMPAASIDYEALHIFKKVSADYIRQQDLYDEETNHGLNTMKQNEWIKQIANELQELSVYAN
jgi:hypothetical protein